MPKVSVIIPTCNRPDLLPRAIKSVLNQTYQDFEIIIIDDGQEKSAESVVRQFNNPRIKYIKHETGKGGAAARNTGVKASSGEYFAFLDDDDEWLPEKLEKQTKVFDSCDDSVVMVFCGLHARNNKNGELLNINLPNQSGVVWPFSKTLYRCYIWTSTIMLRKTVFIQGILFDETLKKNQEWDLQLRLLKLGKFYAINESLVNLYILGENEHMGGIANAENITSAYEMFIKKHYADYIKDRRALAFNYLRLATIYKNAGELDKARETMFKAWSTRLYNLKYFLYFLNLYIKK